MASKKKTKKKKQAQDGVSNISLAEGEVEKILKHAKNQNWMIRSVDDEIDHITTLVVGDFSDDGHGKTERFTIKSNLTTKELLKAYKKGVKKCGVNLTEEVCEEYQDYSISEAVIKKLMKFGLNPSDYGLEMVKRVPDFREQTLKKIQEPDDEFENDYSDNEFEDLYLNHETFTRIWLFISGLGNHHLKYEIMEDNAPVINIGGYGLFE